MSRRIDPGQPDDQGPIMNIVAERLALGPRRRDLLPLYLRWINDFQVTRSLAVGTRPTTMQQEDDWYKNS